MFDSFLLSQAKERLWEIQNFRDRDKKFISISIEPALSVQKSFMYSLF